MYTYAILKTLLLFSVIVMTYSQSIPARVLIYSATAGFRHDSIPTAIASLRARGASINVEFSATEDEAQFTDDILSQYDALLFLSTTGEVLDASGKSAFQSYLNKGGNFVGVHSASDCLVNTTFFGREVGAYFDYHPDLQNAIVDVVGPSHPSTSQLPKEWHVRDEIYNFKSDPRALGAVVVLAANESSYVDNGNRTHDQGDPHPLAWFQTRGSGVDDSHESSAGRSFYTSLGHLDETWRDDRFLSHVLGGLSWALQSNTTRAFNVTALVGNTQTSADKSAPPTPGETQAAPAATPSSGAVVSSVPSALATLFSTILACMLI